MSCECPHAGWCERHQVDKHQRWWELCQAGPHFELWEAGRGPGQPPGNKRYKTATRRKMEQGREAWAALHSYRQPGKWNSKTAAAWYGEWKKMIPSGYGCACTKHWQEIEQQYPPDFSSFDAFWLWGFHRHNDVNRRLGKPEMALADAIAMWRADD